MLILFIVLIVLGLILLFTGIAVEAAKWLIIIAVILLLIGIIGGLLRYIRNRA